MAHEHTQTTDDGFDKIEEALHVAREHGLEIEVVHYALLFMRDNPKLTPAEAIQQGFDEWVK